MVPTKVTEGDSELPTANFLAAFGKGRKVASFLKNQAIFTQGDAAATVFLIEAGRVKHTVVSRAVLRDRIPRFIPAMRTARQR